MGLTFPLSAGTHRTVIVRSAHIFLRLLLVVTILDVTGGHWLALQGVAWTRMIVDYSQRATLTEAVKQAFDGEHPCDMCKGIQKARETQKKQDAQQVVLKRDFLLEPMEALPPAPRPSWDPPAPQLFPSSRQDRPSVPPPRSLVG